MQDLLKEFEEIKSLHLSIDMSRGKPSDEQLKLSEPMLDFPMSGEDFMSISGIDTRNYGTWEGLPEARELMAQLADNEPENTWVVGSSSLQLEYDTIARYAQFGVLGGNPWGKNTKFICLVPGYDRHFAICEHFGFEMICVEFSDDENKMLEQITTLVKNDENIKGIWCVPQYSNPTGHTYSDKFVETLASMETVATDFRIFWDNAYGVHHLYEAQKMQEHVMSIAQACKNSDTSDRYIEFASTSKITFPGAGISCICASQNNLKDFKKSMSVQIIGSDKINQLRHVHFLKDKEHTLDHMYKHASILHPKFDVVTTLLTTELSGYDEVRWTNPKGGYFISFDSAPNTAKRVVELCKEAGVTLTPAGSTWPHLCDPQDKNIRIAPSMPTIKELELATRTLCVATKIAIEERK